MGHRPADSHGCRVSPWRQKRANLGSVCHCCSCRNICFNFGLVFGIGFSCNSLGTWGNIAQSCAKLRALHLNRNTLRDVGKLLDTGRLPLMLPAHRRIGRAPSSKLTTEMRGGMPMTLGNSLKAGRNALVASGYFSGRAPRGCQTHSVSIGLACFALSKNEKGSKLTKCAGPAKFQKIFVSTQ